MIGNFKSGARRAITPEQAVVRLEEACARAERASGEIRDKLRKWGITGTEADDIINGLIDRNFVDDARFTRAFVNDKIKFALWGRRKIRAALYRKGITGSLVDDTLDEIDDEVYNGNLDRILRRKINSTGELPDRGEMARLIRHGISSGYEPDMVFEAVRMLADELKSTNS